MKASRCCTLVVSVVCVLALYGFTPVIASPAYSVDKGKAKKDGVLVVKLKWKDGDKTIEQSKEVAVKKDDNISTIRDNIATALNGDDKVKADWEFKNDSAGFGAVQYTEGHARREGIVELEASICAKEGSVPTNLTISAGQSLLATAYNYFRLDGLPGDADDSLVVYLTTPLDTDMLNPIPFYLPSYHALSPSQIATGLASLIDAHPSFTASVSGSQVNVYGANTKLGADVLLSETSYDTFIVTSGVIAAPEPSALCFLGTGAIGILGCSRLRKRSPAERTARP